MLNNISSQKLYLINTEKTILISHSSHATSHNIKFNAITIPVNQFIDKLSSAEDEIIGVAQENATEGQMARVKVPEYLS